MVINPTNVTATPITWVATPELRLAGKRRNKAELQQLWKNASTGETEWRDVEFVHVRDGD